MSCGCQTACGCNVVGVDSIDVTRIGDTFYVSAPDLTPTPQNLFIQQEDPGSMPYPYVWKQLDEDGNLVTEWVYTP